MVAGEDDATISIVDAPERKPRLYDSRESQTPLELGEIMPQPRSCIEYRNINHIKDLAPGETSDDHMQEIIAKYDALTQSLFLLLYGRGSRDQRRVSFMLESYDWIDIGRRRCYCSA